MDCYLLQLRPCGFSSLSEVFVMFDVLRWMNKSKPNTLHTAAAGRKMPSFDGRHFMLLGVAFIMRHPVDT
jgi:hypothetical protein